MNGDPRLSQVARMLRLSQDGLTAEDARTAISARPSEFADALFAEAADNDDVTGTDSARDYLETRLAELSAFLDGGAIAAVHARFTERLAAWESLPTP